jgi:hypothetical protein
MARRITSNAMLTTSRHLMASPIEKALCLLQIRRAYGVCHM